MYSKVPGSHTYTYIYIFSLEDVQCNLFLPTHKLDVFYSKCCSKQLKGTMVHKWKTCAQLHDVFGTSTVDTWTCQGTKWHITLYNFWGVIILPLYAGGCHDNWSGGGLGFYRSQNRYWVTGYDTGDLLACLCKSMCCLVPGYSSVLVFEVWFLVFHTLVLPCLPSWFTLGVLYTDGPLLYSLFFVCNHLGGEQTSMKVCTVL